MDFRNKHFTILGFGAEGASAARFLLSRGARVSVVEAKSETEFDGACIRELHHAGAAFFFGNTSADFGATDAIVRSPGIPPNHPWLAAAVRNSIPVTSATAIFFEECPAAIVGVTGTKGKGTTSSFIYEMLRAAGRDARLLGNIGAPALDALSGISRDTVVVYELSSFQLMEIRKSPHIAVILMVTEDHLDFHGTTKEYVAAKGNIVRFQGADDFVVANRDYASTVTIAESSAGRKFWVSRKSEVEPGACLDGDGLVISKDGVREKVAAKSDIVIYGAHNLENALAAVMAGELLGLPREALREGLRNFKGLPHRLELVREVNGVKYFDDSISTTPESAAAAVQAFDAPKVMILGGSSKNADFRNLAAVLAADSKVKAVVGLGEEWRRIKDAILKAGKPHYGIFEAGAMQEAVSLAQKTAKPGSVVLLSPGCASFGMFRNYKERGERFREAVEEL